MALNLSILKFQTGGRHHLQHLLLGLFGVVVLLSMTSRAMAEVRVPGFYSDHMVLQRDQPVRLRGWAKPDEQIKVTFGQLSESTTADSHGHWQITLPPMKANANGEILEFSGSDTIRFKDVVVGEVWLCSGQSNMEWTVTRSLRADEEISAADYPLIRHVKIPRRISMTPLDDVDASWETCSSETVGDFTAAGYFMARRLHQELGVPVGLINASWGGTRIEPWTPPVGFQNVEATKSIFESVMGRTPGSDQYQNVLKAHTTALESWLELVKSKAAKNEPIPPSPEFPDSLRPFTTVQEPTMLYNGMIRAVEGYSIRGAIWYQGEANHAEGRLYTEKKRALLHGWRSVWNQGEFPFYFVQIAPFQYGNEAPNVLAEFWEAQQAATEIPNTGMVVINDIATLQDIHPPNKQDVGLRLANLALKDLHDRDDLVAYSPTLDSFEIESGRIILTLKDTGGGLASRDQKPLTDFEVIGVGSGGFQPAVAEIDGDRIVLSSEKVTHPTAFRFAWNKLAEPNLIGGSGLPVGAFRGGKEPEFFESLDLNADYQLVYDLDLNQLGPETVYAEDRSGEIKSFSRIGYLLELESPSFGRQQVFATMPAFTEDIQKISIPTAASGALFQQEIADLVVYSSDPKLVTDGGVKGNIEFWPHNYAPQNGGNVRGARGNIYDFGDQPGEPIDGYGCMQIHLTDRKQTVFAINHWKQGKQADLGIGNSDGSTRDWTFRGNAGEYTSKRLRIFVVPK